MIKVHSLIYSPFDCINNFRTNIRAAKERFYHPKYLNDTRRIEYGFKVIMAEVLHQIKLGVKGQFYG